MASSWNTSTKGKFGNGGAKGVIRKKEGSLAGRSRSAYENSRKAKKTKPVKQMTEEEKMDRIQNFYPAISTQKRFMWQTDPVYFETLLKMRSIEDSKVTPEMLEEAKKKSITEKLMSKTSADGFPMSFSMKRQYKEKMKYDCNNAKRVIQPHIGEEEKPNPNNFDYFYQKLNCFRSPPKIKKLKT